MTTVFNIRGTNGSGKTTLARAFIKGTRTLDLSLYPSPTKRNPQLMKSYPAHHDRDTDVLVLGSYVTACGGMDKHPAGKGFEIPISAIRYALTAWEHDADKPWYPQAIICEGVLASGVYGSWAAFADELRAAGHQLAFVYLHTPAEVCLERIRQRQREAGKEPAAPGTPDYVRMVDNVTGKWKGTMATREKAVRDGRLVYDLPLGLEHDAMIDIVAGNGEEHRAK